MGSKTLYRLVIRRRLPKPPGPVDPSAVRHVDTVLTTHDTQGLALASFDALVRTVGRAFGPYTEHQLLLLPERVRS